MNWYDYIELIFGKDTDVLTFWHMALRALVVFSLGTVLIRQNKRFMELRTPFNFFIYILTGSLLASTIMGHIDFFHGIFTILFIFALNSLISFMVYVSPTIEIIVKGKPAVIVQDGHIRWNEMRKNLITKDELIDALHRHGLTELEQVAIAYFENSGAITIIKK